MSVYASQTIIFGAMIAIIVGKQSIILSKIAMAFLIRFFFFFVSNMFYNYFQCESVHCAAPHTYRNRYDHYTTAYGERVV